MVKITNPRQLSPKNLGQGLTEYLILLVLISLVSIAAVRSLGGTIQRKLTLIRNHIEKVSLTGQASNSSFDSGNE